MDEIQSIHENYINGNMRDAVAQIDDYGHYDFWSDYKEFLIDVKHWRAYDYFSGVCIMYNKIKHR